MPILSPLLGDVQSVLVGLDVNRFHAAYGHRYEVILRETPKALSVELIGELQPYLGFPMTKNLSKPVPSSSASRATTKLECVDVDIFAPHSVSSLWEKRYVCLIMDRYSRFTL